MTEAQQPSATATAIVRQTTNDPQQMLKAMLEQMKPALAAVLPKHVTPDRMLKVVLSATARQPALLECTRTSIVRAVMQAGEIGLEIGGLLGEAYLVPYNNKVKDSDGREHWEKMAQCIVGYKGLIKLARQSGQIASISAWPVYRGDHFRPLPAEERIEHEPNINVERNEENLVAVYAVARFREAGSQQVDFMTMDEIERIRQRSKTKDFGPWVTDKVEMARKTVVRRLCKYLPVSAELAKALEMEIEHDEEERTHRPSSSPVAELPSFIIPEVEHTNGAQAQGRGRRLANQVRKNQSEREVAENPPFGDEPKEQPKQEARPKTQPVAQQAIAGAESAQQASAASSVSQASGGAQTKRQEDQPLSIAEERAKVLAEHTALLAAFPHQVGVAVYVTLPDGEIIESYTKSLARMHGDVAVVEVADAPKNPVLLSWVKPLARQPGDD